MAPLANDPRVSALIVCGGALSGSFLVKTRPQRRKLMF
jgi:hypothetical protein